MFRLLICGGRYFGSMLDPKTKKIVTNIQDITYFYTKTSEIINNINQDILIIHGGAKGADTLANEFALENNIPVSVFPANWVKYGKAAGVIRNTQMLEEGKPNLVLAFPGGPGTRNMCMQAKLHKIPVIKV